VAVWLIRKLAGSPRPGEGTQNAGICRESRTRPRSERRRLWHPWLRINRALSVMLQTRWGAEAWSVVRVEFRRALALRSEIRR